MVEACDIVPADQCCGVIPCRLCLEWEDYDGIAYGSADFGTSSWTGTVGGHTFVSYWQRDEYGECEYIVTLDGEEVYRATCYEGASCRNPAGEVAVSTAYAEGTLRWSVYHPRELELIDHPETGCRDHFCGGCRCSCECLCVTITEPDSTVITGEICDTAYDCDPPLWAGTVGYYDLALQLARDEYGECVIVPTVDGEELESVAAPGCASMSATITLYDGTTIAVSCKRCACEDDQTQNPCIVCPEGTIYPWAVAVTFVDLDVSADSGNQDDPDQDGELTYHYPVEGDYGGYTIQALFEECAASVVISQGETSICSFSGTEADGLTMEAVSCPGRGDETELTLIYTIPCGDGTITVVING